ncbi:MAG: phage tail assembly chaperone [Alphaproteobacteria bacterium]|nr:phage tail assembly chaperone [Alphaproteobacteria bacterium]
MQEYSQITDGKTTQRGALPKNYKNVYNLKHASAEELQAIGWLPNEIIGAECNQETQIRTEDAEEIKADKVIITQNVRALTTEELAERETVNWQALRKERNRLLTAIDWRACSDLTMPQEWKDYRQTLRDLPTTTTNPANPVYPDEPE